MALEIDGYAPGHWSKKGPDGGNYYAMDTYGPFCVDIDENGQELPSPHQCGDWKEHAQVSGESLRALAEADCLWSTPMADGHAYYYIHCEDPLTLVFINFMDAYRAHPALIKGLDLSHVEEERRFHQAWREARDRQRP